MIFKIKGTLYRKERETKRQTTKMESHLNKKQKKKLSLRNVGYTNCLALM